MEVLDTYHAAGGDRSRAVPIQCCIMWPEGLQRFAMFHPQGAEEGWREQMETLAQTISTLRNHVESRNMYHFKMEEKQQFQVFKSPEELLKFCTEGTATSNNVVGNQVVGEVEQS